MGVLANNNGKIPDNELRQIRKYILMTPCLTKNKIKRIINIKRQLVVESRFSSKIYSQKETVLPLGGFFHAVITYDT